MTAPLRILFVSHRADLSGAPRCVLELVRGLDPARFRSEVAIEEEGPLARMLDTAAARLHPGCKEQWRGPGGLLRAIRLVRESQPDLVHVNRAVGLSKTFALAARLLRRPVIWHLHDEFHSRRLQRRLPWVRRLASEVVCCSQAVARTPGLGPCRVIPNGVRFDGLPGTQELTPAGQHSGEGSASFRFLFVGTIIPRKNVHLLVDAAAKVLQQQPDTCFLAVGDGDDTSYRRQVAGHIAELGMKERFQLLPAQEDVAPFYAASHVLVLPSLSEAMPLVILEAAAHGVASVATDVGDTAAMIQDGDTGWLLRRNAGAAELAALLMEIRHRGPAAARETGRAAHRWLAGRFGLERYVQSFASLYEQLAGRASGPARDDEIAATRAAGRP